MFGYGVTALMALVELSATFVAAHRRSANDPRRQTTVKKPLKPYYFTSEDEVNKFLNENLYENNSITLTHDDVFVDQPVRFVPRPIEFGTKEHAVHVENLKNVNGYKPKNLYIRTTKDDNPYFYITNPIEAKFPHPFVPTIDIKDIMWERIQLQKDILYEKNRDKLKYIPRYQYMKKPKQRIPYREMRRRAEEFSTEKEIPEHSTTVTVTTTRRTVHTLSPAELKKKEQHARELDGEDPIFLMY